jgi:hypothetical protein
MFTFNSLLLPQTYTMKKTITLLVTLLTVSAFGQQFQEKEFDQYSFEANYGFNGTSTPSMMNFGHFGVGFRYMWDRTWGIKLEYAQDRFRDGGAIEKGSDYKRYSIQGVANIGRMINSEMEESRIGLLAHGGLGYASINSILKSGTDNTMHLMAGLTPQYHLTDSFSINFDLALVMNFSQHYNYDGTYPNGEGPGDGFIGKVVNASVGLTFYPAPRKGRSDWKLE